MEGRLKRSIWSSESPRESGARRWNWETLNRGSVRCQWLWQKQQPWWNGDRRQIVGERSVKCRRVILVLHWEKKERGTMVPSRACRPKVWLLKWKRISRFYRLRGSSTVKGELEDMGDWFYPFAMAVMFKHFCSHLQWLFFLKHFLLKLIQNYSASIR